MFRAILLGLACLLCLATGLACEPTQPTSCSGPRDCLADERCDPTTNQCTPHNCPSGSPDKAGDCPCKHQETCAEGKRCLGGYCKTLCHPGGEGPDSGCRCPTGWEWHKGDCHKRCPTRMFRHPDGHCEPDHPKHYPAFWERTKAGKIQKRCFANQQRDATGRCALPPFQAPSRPKPPTQTSLTTGPQKPCPKDPKDRWDEAYISRAGLPPETPKSYVDANATAPGDGSKERPFVSLQAALNAAPPKSVLLLAPGTYDWGASIKKPLHLVGRCTAGVKLPGNNALGKYGVSIQATDVTIEGLSLISTTGVHDTAIDIREKGASTTLRHLHIEGARRVGIAANFGRILIEHTRITKIRELAAIFAYTMSKVTIKHSHIHDNPSPALHHHLNASTLIQNNLFVRNDTGLRKAGLYFVKLIGPLSLEGNVIREHPQNAILLSQVTTTTIKANLLAQNGAKLSDGSAALTGGDFSGKVTISDNVFQDNAANAIFLRRMQNTDITGNLFEGTEHIGAVLVDPLKPEHLLRLQGNTFTKNSGGVLIDALDGAGCKVEAKGNDFIDNLGSKGQHKGGLILFHNASTPAKGPLLVQGNRFQNNAYGGLISQKAGPMELRENRFIGNGASHSAPTRKSGCYLVVTADLTLRNNSFAEQIGCVIGALIPAKVLVEGNRFDFRNPKGPKATLPPLDENHGLQLAGPLSASIRHNAFQIPGGSLNTINADIPGWQAKDPQVQEILAEGNSFQQHPLAAKQWRYNVVQWNLVRKLTMRANRFEDISGHGIVLFRTGEVSLEENLLRGKVPKTSSTSPTPPVGIFGEGTIGALDLRANATLSFPIGATLHAATQPLTFTENTWAKHRFVGLALRNLLQPATLTRESFLGNGGRHLLLLNHHKETKVRGSAFVRAAPADALGDTLAKSDGIGLQLSAQGVVRWVFAQADYACSPARQDAAPKLKDGWTMRPVRTPVDLDPCLAKDPKHRTPETRFRASLCYQRCKGKGCRWVWQDIGVGDNHGKGLWQPTGTIQCVDAKEYDSCLRPASFANTTIKPIATHAFLRGECLPSAKINDPCDAAARKACGTLICGRNTDGIGPNYRAFPRCYTREASVCTTTSGASLCPPDHRCFEFARLFREASPQPSPLSLEDNVFWFNQSVDISLDMAGKTVLGNNLYSACLPTKPCPQRVVFARRAGKRGVTWAARSLPPGTSILWQTPSPYDTPYTSALLGSDLRLTHKGTSLLLKPGLCQASATR